MTTATALVWPTEESLEPVATALSAGFNAVENLNLDIGAVLGPWMAKGTWPESPPTLETVGALYSFLDLLRTEAAELERMAKELEQDMWQIAALRRDWREPDAR